MNSESSKYAEQNQRNGLFELFIRSGAILLLLTATAKLVSAFGHSRILLDTDPIFGISFKSLFLLCGSTEMGIAFVCLFYHKLLLRTFLLAWLAVCFLAYRIGLHWIGYQKSCKCLGDVTDALNISPQTADIAMKTVLVYLLTGSCGILFFQSLKTRKLAVGK